MKKTILYVNPTGDITGGSEKSLLVLLEGLDKSKYSPVLVVPNNGSLANAANSLGVEIKIFPIFTVMLEKDIQTSLKNATRALFSINKLNQLITKLHADLVHVNTYRAGIPFSIAANRLTIPSVWHIRSIPKSNLKKFLVRKAIEIPTLVISISQAVSEAIGISDKNSVKLVYNGVRMQDYELNDNRVFRDELNLAADDILFCSVGQLVPWKGHDLIIKSFAKISNPKTFLVIVGGNVSVPWSSIDQMNNINYLHKLVEDLNLEDRVFFTGFRNDVPDILSACNVYVHGATFPEPFGRVIVEAMLAGKPVIAPKWGGIPEIIVENYSGVFFEPANQDDLTCKMIMAIEDKEKFVAMGENGRAVALEKFTIEQHAAKIAEIYEQLI